MKHRNGVWKQPLLKSRKHRLDCELKLPDCSGEFLSRDECELVDVLIELRKEAGDVEEGARAYFRIGS